MVFTLVYLELDPQISITTSSGDVRNHKIQSLIASCKYSIHDLCRSKSLGKGELPRFNMPYELGLDIGANAFGEEQLRSKKILILETEKYQYQKFISDLAGQDIEDHKDDPYLLIEKVRNWLSNNSNGISPPATVIWNAYNVFLSNLSKTLKDVGYSEREQQLMPIGDFIKFCKDWISQNKTI